ncbi:MAG: hypothetical protein VKL23_08520 [Cyanobacteriota bacterium]|nr:hypothetical protein [Cyanobacteriota bacterium]
MIEAKSLFLALQWLRALWHAQCVGRHTPSFSLQRFNDFFQVEIAAWVHVSSGLGSGWQLMGWLRLGKPHGRLASPRLCGSFCQEGVLPEKSEVIHVKWAAMSDVTTLATAQPIGPRFLCWMPI